ncbi:hypothetical protein IWQ60_004614 [Tieghemiomyces parasiticus]|uniref:Prolactin regulatory element-binding protein n=1 Tax=Tieghemiomyces parasiticus TaxID=78921 RepID=A0A9W8AFK9_9FUNG|nr:hypothetical protein IWQ60_004614 [Tieghemiomyces parasiticus]
MARNRKSLGGKAAKSRGKSAQRESFDSATTTTNDKTTSTARSGRKSTEKDHLPDPSNDSNELTEKQVPTATMTKPARHVEPFQFVPGIPVNCLSGVGSHPSLFVLGGGGGPSRSGVANKIQLNYIDDETHTVTTLATYNIPAGQDAPTSISVHPTLDVIASGINFDKDTVEAGRNQSARTFRFDITQGEIEPVKTVAVLETKTLNDYQKVTVFSPKGDRLLTGGSEGSIHLLEYPSLTNVFPVLKSESGEIMGADFSASGGQCAVATGKEVSVFSTRTGKGVQHIECPVYKNKHACRFRTCLYGRGLTKDYFYTVVNTLDRDRSLVAKWSTRTWEMETFRTVSRFPIIAAAMHPDGQYLAVATTENTVYILDSHSFRTLAKSTGLHSFAITSLAFTSDGSYLISGSIDNTCGIVPIPDTFPESQMKKLIFILLAIIIVLVSVVYHLHNSPEPLIAQKMREAQKPNVFE